MRSESGITNVVSSTNANSHARVTQCNADPKAVLYTPPSENITSFLILATAANPIAACNKVSHMISGPEVQHVRGIEGICRVNCSKQTNFIHHGSLCSDSQQQHTSPPQSKINTCSSLVSFVNHWAAHNQTRMARTKLNLRSSSDPLLTINGF